MDIKLKYKAWVSEKHADIAHKLMDSDIETFALEFTEHLVKNCSIPAVVGQSEQLKAFKQAETLVLDNTLKVEVINPESKVLVKDSRDNKLMWVERNRLKRQ